MKSCICHPSPLNPNLQYLVGEILNFVIQNFRYLASQILNFQFWIVEIRQAKSQNSRSWIFKCWTVDIWQNVSRINVQYLSSQILNFQCLESQIFNFQYLTGEILNFQTLNCQFWESQIPNFQILRFLEFPTQGVMNGISKTMGLSKCSSNLIGFFWKFCFWKHLDILPHNSKNHQ